MMQNGPLTRAPKLRLNIQVKDADGHVRDERDFDANLATDNMTKVWKALLLGHDSDAEILPGEEPLQMGGGAHTTWDNQFLNQPSWIHIGDGGGAAVSPARSDYTLVNILGSTPISGVTRGDGSPVTTCSAAFVNNSGGTWTIREVGLSQTNTTVFNTALHVLLFHDAVSDTAVLNNETITVTYTWTWP